MMEKITTVILKPPIEKLSLAKEKKNVHGLVLLCLVGGFKWITPDFRGGNNAVLKEVWFGKFSILHGVFSFLMHGNLTVFMSQFS